MTDIQGRLLTPYPPGALEDHYLPSLQRLLELAHGVLSHEIAAELDAAYRKVASFPRPRPEAVFEHVYGQLPRRVRHQRDNSLKRLRARDDV